MCSIWNWEKELNYATQMTSLVAQTVKNMPAMQETRVQSLSQEDPLEKDMATHSSILAWRIPWREEPSGLHSRGSQSVRRDWSNLAHTQPFKLLPSSSIKYFSFLLTLIFLLFSYNLTSVHFFKKLWDFSMHFP